MNALFKNDGFMISVVMPGYNVERTVGENLETLLKQAKGFRERVEIIFVDDGSKDNTIGVVKKFGVRVIKQKHAGPAVARNKGIRAANGRIVIFLDADCKVSKNWLKEITKPFEDERVAGVGVKYETWNKYSWVARFVGYEIEQRHKKMVGDVDFLASYSSAFRKDILVKLGGFDTSFAIASAEDNDLSYRIKSLGYRLIFLKKTFVYHKHPESLINYFRKQYNHGKWRIFLYAKYSTNLKVLKGDKYAGWETFAQPLLFLLMPFSFLFLQKWFLLTVAVNIAIHIPAVAMVWKKRDFGIALLMPFLFLIRTFLWGFGAFVGVLQFLKSRTLKKVK
jgi:glycosyltransferase involved in cell wall biosynthesis